VPRVPPCQAFVSRVPLVPLCRACPVPRAVGVPRGCGLA
jgi:hypothetical protein